MKISNTKISRIRTTTFESQAHLVISTLKEQKFHAIQCPRLDLHKIFNTAIPFHSKDESITEILY